MEKDQEDIFITIIGFNKFHGTKPFQLGSVMKLVKEPDNHYDTEAIAIEMRYVGKAGYVANSVNTVVKGTMSAGRLYDKITNNQDFAEVKFIANQLLIAKLVDEERLEELKKDVENDVHYLLKQKSTKTQSNEEENDPWGNY